MNKSLPQFTSVLAPHFVKLIEEQKAAGYKTTNMHLKKLDQFLNEQGLKKAVLPQKMVELWLRRRENESPGTYEVRLCAVRVFARFLTRQNISAFSPPKFSTPKFIRSFVPYIFSREEIARLFKAADYLEKTKLRYWHFSYFHIVIRLLYSTGLRSGEVNGLIWRHVDLKNGILTICQGKFLKDRLVPLSSQMAKCLCEYARKHPCHPNEPVFPSMRGKHCHPSQFYRLFREVLKQAKIPHGGKGKGPRLHDLRHTFAVHNLENWLKSKQNLQAKLPILADYLGHTSLLGTQKYLRLTQYIFPEIVTRMEKSIGKSIRNLERETH